MRAAFGGDLADFTDAALDELKNTFKMSEGHLVNSSLQPFPEVAERLHKRGMKAIYNIEQIWIGLMNNGQSVYGDISGYRSALQAIKDAGWDGVVSEGLSAKQVSIIREYFPYYINEGGERGENVYDPNSMYYRDPSMAGANYLETYHKGVNYDIAFKSANQSTPNDMGMTFMMYDTASLETDTDALLVYMEKVKNELGINLKVALFWVGFEQSALAKLRGAQWNTFWNRLNTYDNFTIDNKPIVGGNTEMFLDAVRGTDNQVWYQTRKNDKFSEWASLGGAVTSEVQVQYDPETETFDVRVRGTDNERWHNYYNTKTSKWSGWVGSGGQIKDNGDLEIVDGKPA